MRYLPHETAARLAAENSSDLADYLIAWAMLLTSDCPLVQDQGVSPGVVSLEREERIAIALEIQSLLRFYERCRSTTRSYAEQLWAQWQGGHSGGETSATQERHSHRTIEQLAQEMLAIHLG